MLEIIIETTKPRCRPNGLTCPPGAWQKKRHVHFWAEIYCVFRVGFLYLAYILFMNKGNERLSQTNKR